MTTKNTQAESLSIRDLLCASPLFKSLDEAGQQHMVELGRSILFQKGDVLIREGDEGEAMFVIRQGQVQVQAGKGEDDVVLRRLGPGAVLGEVAIITGQKRTATVVALEEVEAIAFPSEGIQALLEVYPKIAKLLRATSDSRSRETLEKVGEHSCDE